MVNYGLSGATDFEQLLDPLPKDIRQTAIRFRAIVKATIPNADESVSGGAKMGMALYSINGPNNVICGIQPTEDMCKLFFHCWEQLKKSGYRLEGTGKHARHIKVRSPEELEADAISKMIKLVCEFR